MDTVNQVLRNKVSRRKFVAGIGAGVGATAAVALAAGCSSSNTPAPGNPVTTPTPPASTVTDVDILNFALNLEYLEAEFYLRAVTGSGLSSADSLSGAGTVTGGTQVPGLTGSMLNFAVEIAQDELNHVRAIQATITAKGGTPVARPQIDFTDAFNGLASAAGIGSAFNPFTANGSITAADSFLLGSFVFEDVGVTAYTGAAYLIQDTTVLSAAAGIQAVEAYHAGALRTLLVAEDAAIVAGGGVAALVATANKISAARGALGGGNETMLSSMSIVAADGNALAYARTTDQVLHIVYATAGGSGAASGGFFPAGLNGTIKTTAS